jgi:hypothetical protein
MPRIRVHVRFGFDTTIDLPLQFVKHREAVAVRGVSDLVREPREAVDRHQVTALFGG